MPKEDTGFRGVSLKSDLVEEIEHFITIHSEYRSVADFVSEAIRIRMQEIKKINNQKAIPRFEHFNKGENGVRISDRKLHQIADIYFKPQGIFCDLDKTDSCEHIDFALTIPEIQEIIRKKKKKEGWKLPDI